MEWTRWMSYCVTNVMDTPFLPSEKIKCSENLICSSKRRPKTTGVLLFCNAVASQTTCSRCSPDSVDVSLGKPRGVMVNDHLHSGNIQTPLKSKQKSIRTTPHDGPETYEALRDKLPGSYIRRNQDFINAGLELGEVGESLFLDKIHKRSLIWNDHSSTRDVQIQLFLSDTSFDTCFQYLLMQSSDQTVLLVSFKEANSIFQMMQSQMLYKLAAVEFSNICTTSGNLNPAYYPIGFATNQKQLSCKILSLPVSVCVGLGRK